MKNTNNDKSWAWTFGILLVLLVVSIAVHAHKTPDTDGSAMMGTTTSDTTAMTPSEDLTAGSADLPATTGVAPVSISYQEALTKYANARFQFDNSCAATPNAATFATGRNIMLDNRSAETRTIHLGSLGSVTVKGYGFKIVNLSLAGLNANALAIDCDAHQNVAIITVQK